MSQADDLIACRHVLCILDILGQKDKLAGWEQLPTDKDQYAGFTKALKGTVGTVLTFKKQFVDYFHQVEKSTIPNLIAALPPETQVLYQRYQDCKLSTQRPDSQRKWRCLGNTTAPGIRRLLFGYAHLHSRSDTAAWGSYHR